MTYFRQLVLGLFVRGFPFLGNHTAKIPNSRSAPALDAVP